MHGARCPTDAELVAIFLRVGKCSSASEGFTPPLREPSSSYGKQPCGIYPNSRHGPLKMVTNSDGIWARQTQS
ncbi:hypothetical protein [Polynucleobacter necessarius]|uniref:hypothetical protein n=1 Tax=Polynucleobacter necessarius TaxID=576610 RepID=UPI0039E3B346